MSKPTTYNSSPVKSGEVTETRQAINEASKSTTPTGGVNRKPQQPRAIRCPISEHLRVHAQPPERPGPVNDDGNNANPWTRRHGPKAVRQDPRVPSHQSGTSRNTLVTGPSGLILRVKAKIFPATKAFFLAEGFGAGEYLTRI